MAWFGTKFEQNCWKIEPGLSAYSSQQQEKAERQQKTSRVQFCSNLVPNHFTGLSVAPRSLADSVHSLKKKLKLFLLKNLIFLDSNAVEWRRWLSVIMENVLNSWQCFFQPDNETAFKVKVFSDWRQIKHCKTLQKKNQSPVQHSTLIW